jgi:hypothetical protein
LLYFIRHEYGQTGRLLQFIQEASVRHLPGNCRHPEKESLLVIITILASVTYNYGNTFWV